MRLAHLADLHLGFRQFARLNPKGANIREADVNLAFHRAIDQVIAAGVDAVVIAGDLFHSIRPTNGAVLFLFQELQRLRVGLPWAKVVLVAGNHDTPRSSETSCILPLYRALDVEVAVTEIRHIPFGSGWTITAVPSGVIGRLKGVAPLGSGGNVLLAHGEVQGFGAEEIGPDTLAQPWDYIALGHYHVCARVADSVAWYSGSLDYTSTDPWGEMREERGRDIGGKGWLLWDSVYGAPIFQRIEAPRRFTLLGPVDATGMSPDQVMAAFAALVEATEVDGSVVRLLCENCPRTVSRVLDHRKIAEWKGRALNFQIAFTRPPEEAATVEGRSIRMKRLDDIVDEFLGARELPSDVGREELRALGREYLDIVRQEHTDATGGAEATEGVE